MNIRDVMTPNPRTVTPDDTIQSAARIMRDEDTGAVPVVENGRAVGMVTDRDIVVRAVADGGQLNRPVREIVTSAVVTATPDMSTREAAQLMSEHQIRRLPVVENERLVGIVSLGDLAVKEGKDSRSGDTLQSISEGVKERADLLKRHVEHPEHPGGHERQDDEEHDRDDRQPRPPRTLEQRAFGRRLDARLGRRVAASIADQRLVGDLGSAVCANHRGSGIL